MIIDVGSDKSVTIDLGRQGENAVTEVTFDFSAFYDEFGQGSIALVMQRTKVDEPYPIIMDVDGTYATWTVSSTDTAYKGTGKVQLFYIVNKQIKKSVIFKTRVEPSIETEDLPDDPYMSYLEQMVVLGTEVRNNADHVDEVAATIDTTATEISSIDSSFRAFAAQAQSDLSGARTDALGAIDTAKTGAVSDVNTAKSGALTNISSAQTTALGEISSAKSGALSDIATAKTGATTDIASARSGALTDIGSAKTTALSDIETALDDAIEELSKVNYTYTDTGDGDIVIERTGD